MNPNTKHSFETIMAKILPHIQLGSDKTILAQVMIALILEGIIKDNPSEKEKKMIKLIKSSIEKDPYKSQEALRIQHRLLES